MKKIINGMLAATALAVVFTSCDREKAAVDTPEGTTSFELKLQLATNDLPAGEADGQTRATSDPNATADEAALKTADVYIYSGNGDYLSHTHLDATAFTQGTSTTTADVYTATTAIKTTTGDKFFHVALNIPTDMAAAIENQPIASLRTIVNTMARTVYTPASNGLPMFSVAAVSATMAAAPTVNTVTIPVQRIVAKVTVQQDAAMTKNGPGFIGPLSWALNNVNTKFYFMQGQPSANADPNWRNDAYDATHFSAATETDYVAVNESTATTATYNARYAIENTSDRKAGKELNRVTIRAQFSPQRWVAQGTYTPPTEPADADNPNYSATAPTYVTFYTVQPTAQSAVRYFQAQTGAQTYATNNGNATVNTFTNGWCYWNTFVNNSRGGEMLRNDYYRINIRSILAPGRPTDALTNPDAPAATDVDVTATVNVLYWNAQTMENKNLVP